MKKKRISPVGILSCIVVILAIVLLAIFVLLKRQPAGGAAESAKTASASAGSSESVSESESDASVEETSVSSESNSIETSSSAEEAAVFGSSVEELAQSEEKEPELNVDEVAPRTILEPEQVAGLEDSFFKAYEIQEGDEIYQRIIGKSYVENDDIALSDLRYLKMLHYNFEDEIRMGEMIVNASIAEDVLEIFRALYDRKYQINTMFLIDDVWQGEGNATDTYSCDIDNTSAFCYRPITGNRGVISRHALGLAIDLNPRENPYTTFEEGGGFHCSHSNAYDYMSPKKREESGNPAVVLEGDDCYNLFIERGFRWGGFWRPIADYQHFEIPREN